MGKNEEKYNKRRLQTSYFTTVVSITLVLFMLGLLGIILYHAKKASEYVKENIGLTVIMNDNVPDASILAIKKSIDNAGYIKESKFITREEAAKSLMKDLGEDFVGFLGYNPLLPSLELRMKADYANSDSLKVIEKGIAAHKEVKEIVYQKSLVEVVNKNLRKISFVILGFSTLLLLVSIALINNTIRLAVYSKRFLIKTMQLVGATENFIRWPFLKRGIGHGFIGALAALVLLAGIMYLAQKQLPELLNLQDVKLYFTLFGFVTLLGIIISTISTFFAVRKYLRIRTEYLY
ncbi:MAG: permease-like cell division protein FtsX [Bacteroidetes bacterium]|nr:permease-like cell division protein FtsX [Bacteroidota bacterium]